MDYSKDGITLFDRINLAHSARLRASQNVMNEERFNGEYDTARMWLKYRCVKTTIHSYVEND